jgi:hypothetical protein
MFPHARLARPWLISSALLAATAAGGCTSFGGESSPSVLLDGMATESGDGGTSAAGFGDANACRPGDVETYQPKAYRPAAAAWQGVCSAAQIGSFYDDCLGAQATTTTCTAFKSDKTSSPCAACILTLDTASHDGPLISHGTFITTNVAGCIELTDSAGLSCAKALQALSGCELYACQANCPVHDSASRMAFDSCADQASNAGCASYDMATGCVAAERDAGRAADCLLPAFSDFYNAVAPLFCGAPASDIDAGSPPFDASAGEARGAIDDASVDVRLGVVGDARTEAATDGVVEAAKD